MLAWDKKRERERRRGENFKFIHSRHNSMHSTMVQCLFTADTTVCIVPWYNVYSQQTQQYAQYHGSVYSQQTQQHA